MKNECLKLIGDDITMYERDLAETKDMVSYLRSENYTIWVDTKGYKFHIQMKGQKTESQEFDIATDAIIEAENRK